MMKLEISLTVLSRSYILTAYGQWCRKIICGRLGRSITTFFQGARLLFYPWLISNALQWGCGKVLFFLLPSPLPAHNDSESLMGVFFNSIAASRKTYHQCLESERATKRLRAGSRLPSTCNWIIDHNVYRDWSAAKGPPCLWVTGSAGTGKSAVVSAMIDDLLAHQQQRDVIAYCFLEEGLGSDDFAKQILEVLFRQIEEKDAVPDHLLYSLLPKIENTDSLMSREAFQRVLGILLGNVDCQTRIVLILDGVDKDEWIKCVVIDEAIRMNSSRHRSNLMRCLISSREGYDCNTRTSQSRNIALDNHLGVQRDVLQFAESRLAETYPTIANAKTYLTSVAKKICLQGQGNFLWVAMVIESLQATFTIAEAEKEIQSLPPTVDGLYQRVLQSIPSPGIETVQRAFAWLIAATRPLKLPELVEALATGSDPHEPPGNAAVSCWIRMCRPLVTTTRENIVRFRHSSVRRHLLSADGTGIWGTSMVEAHTVLARTCLMVLTAKENMGLPFPSWPEKTGCTSSIKSYASTNWSLHYGLAESHSKRLVGALHHSLTVALHNVCEHLSLPETARLDQIETTILRIAAYYGFASLSQVSLEMGVDQRGSCDSCETPLMLAAAGDHSQVVALLMQRGASAGASISSHGETALLLAAATGSQETVNLLLKGDAKAFSNAGYSSRTPLHAAASSGNLEIMKLLMEFNVDLNIMASNSGETPLHLAASRGHLQTVKWLVEGLGASDEEMQSYESMVRQRYYQAWTQNLLADSPSNRRLSCGREAKCSARESLNELRALCGRYADINVRTREGRTALHLAVSNGHVPTARFLLQTGADVNILDNNRYTALRLAAENGHLKAVQLLLMAGADLDTDQLGTTLKSITNNGHDKVANLLAWYFFSVELTGKPCQWPVLALATKSKHNTVRDAIRKSYHDGHKIPQRARIGAPSQDRKM